MNPGTIKKWVVLALLAAGSVWFGWAVLLGRPDVTHSATWQTMASPGPLSSGHAFLANNCAACHTPVKGVEAASCVACHANNEILLQRQPTAFHATVGSCAECHREHQGNRSSPTVMDHGALAGLGLRQAEQAGKSDPSAMARHDTLAAWIGGHTGSAALPPGRSAVSGREAALNCAACHSNQDRHLGLFGTSCVQCHATTAWTIPEFRHPAPNSTSCVQCHQAPPSHYMMHFKMVSMKTARQPHAQVNECFTCHQTTAWNDIKGVGWYKHH